MRRLRQADAVDQAGVVPLVGQDEVVGRNDRLQQADVGGVSRAEQQRGLGAGEGGEPLLDALEDFVMSAQQARAARPGRKIRRAPRASPRQSRVAGEAEVVVRDEIDAAAAAASAAEGRRAAARLSMAAKRSSNSCRAVMPETQAEPSHELLSSSTVGLGEVSSFSPEKIELAPATKQSACASSDSASRPADRRTRALGATRRAQATVRTSSERIEILGIGERRARRAHEHVHGQALGVRIRRPSCASSAQRSRADSPMPMMPPQQTLSPASCTWRRVSSRS